MEKVKLYFYVVRGKELFFEECEAEKHGWNYRLLREVRGFYNKTVTRHEIGVKPGIFHPSPTVILDKRDDDLAKKLLSSYYNKKIKDLKETIKIIDSWELDEDVTEF